MKKTLALVLMILTVFSMVGITANATGVEPRWNNTNTATVVLGINSSGKATISYNCMGISSLTTSITAETKLERKWGLLWLDVDGAEWTDTTTNTYLSKTHNIQLSKTGTYRATTKFTVSGSGGSNDSIKVTSQDTYE